MIWFSQEARAYMLLAALSGASFLWFNRARVQPTKRNVAWWTACSALAVMTHFFAGFLTSPQVAAAGLLAVADVAAARYYQPQLRASLPRIARESGLVARRREERFGVPLPLGRDLREQQAALPALLHDETMATDDDVGRAGNRLEWSEQRDLDLEIR